MEYSDYLYELHSSDGDISDMTVHGYYVGDDGSIYRECTHTYLNVEFFRGKFKKEYRVLQGLSEYLKGVIFLEELLNKEY